MVTAKYRHLTNLGAFQITGYATRSGRIPLGAPLNTTPTGQQKWRGYIEANGKLQFSPHWSLTGYGRLASDRTFLRRYDITSRAMTGCVHRSISSESTTKATFRSLAG